MAQEVKVCIDLLESAAGIYDQQINNLKDAYQRVKNAIEPLRNSEWKTTGADFFFQNYDDEWNKSLLDHISYLEHLRDCLKLAREGFNEEYNKKIEL